MRRIAKGKRFRADGRGFTVMEMLLVIFVGVVVLGVIGGALIRTVRVSHDEVNRMTRTMTVRLAMEQVARDIQSSFAYRSPETGQVLFVGADGQLGQGAADQLTLIRPKQGTVVPTELEKVVYEVRAGEGAESSQIWMKRQSLDGATQREVVLGLPEATTNLRMNLQYRSAGAPWQPSWEASNRLPDAVKVELEAADTRQSGVVRFETVVYLPSAEITGATS